MFNGFDNYCIDDLSYVYDYFNIDNSIAYDGIIDKNRSIKQVIMDLSGLNEDQMIMKSKHLQLLDYFIYKHKRAIKESY